MTIYFYSPREQPYGCFSNFSRHGISMEDDWYPTVEHYFQAQKFAGTPYAEQIQRAATPKQAAELGRSRSVPLRADWESVKDGIMLAAVQCKFETPEALRALRRRAMKRSSKTRRGTITGAMAPMAAARTSWGRR